MSAGGFPDDGASASFETADAFLAQSHLFHLGGLTTERQHPQTMHLSEWAAADLPHALAVVQQCELAALDAMMQYGEELETLRAKVQAALAEGRNIFLGGCGATGRLAITLEFLWREAAMAGGRRHALERVHGFTAGGDLALVRSVESFEDHPAFGARQLDGLGFTAQDLMIGITEGGETPFVIGAVEHAARFSEVPPSFVFCNPVSDLALEVVRSKRVFENPHIDSLSVCVGPMLLSGSTRMEASTALMLAVGMALLGEEQGEPVVRRLRALRTAVERTDFAALAPFVEREAQAFGARDHILYESRDYAITILTDTTERHPTFNIAAFENVQDEDAPLSEAYFVFPGTRTPQESWHALLARPPRALDWNGYETRVGLARLYGYDFSENARARRRRLAPPGTRVHPFVIARESDSLAWNLDELRLRVPIAGLTPLLQHVLLKILLNTHSTLMMGRCGRYQGNVMTWVRPTNGKLIDRAIRYVQHLLNTYSTSRRSYEEICHELFAAMQSLTPQDSVVLKTYERLTGTALKSPEHPGTAKEARA
ncbi:MAG TPA: hypothetical protein VEC57_12060 [Candidatus Limnocylindrales bacterium]|nr:hypothetical protein [Candidatus Limnocylindrales bacterium]